MSRFAVILPAAGRSSRFGGMEKKPFVSLDGRPVWQRAAEPFWKRDDVSKVYLVIAPEDRADFRHRFGHILAFTNAEVVDGGAERFESVANALAHVPETVEFVAVHDAVRPLLTTSLLESVFHAAEEHGAAMPAVPVADTLKQVDESTSRITGTVPRAGLWQAQTPQVFRRDWLVAAYANRAALPAPITDDAQLIETIGHPVFVVPGSSTNFKITTKEDLELAEAVLKARAAKTGSTPATPRWARSMTRPSGEPARRFHRGKRDHAVGGRWNGEFTGKPNDWRARPSRNSDSCISRICLATGVRQVVMIQRPPGNIGLSWCWRTRSAAACTSRCIRRTWLFAASTRSSSSCKPGQSGQFFLPAPGRFGSFYSTRQTVRPIPNVPD